MFTVVANTSLRKAEIFHFSPTMFRTAQTISANLHLGPNNNSFKASPCLIEVGLCFNDQYWLNTKWLYYLNQGFDLDYEDYFDWTEEFVMEELSILQYQLRLSDENSFKLILLDFAEFPASNFGCSTCEQSIKKLKRCSRCRKTRYCSVECQRQDWNRHKETCASSS